MADKTAVAFHFNAPSKLTYACKLVRKLQRMDMPLVVLAAPDVVAELDLALWSFGGEPQFLAHCRADAAAAVLQRSPTVLASQVDAGLPHKRVLLNLSDRMPDDFAQFERVIEVVSADDDNDRQLARQRWRDYTAQGYAIERRDLVMKTDD
ncbi:DNA polymerase III subunit chi [Comamonas odontotermitis]|uniref:DNA polymerase III subunit chi n=1 Tax=Comamonas TaxID=283 RepID=UPI001CC73648|nr:DNA polymerase III subunit chi [Comamonas odontotermitis]UBB18862.1 DNA polymerase III subunit chi [Comamonas odontotermitis]